jgi:hypothetical protein
VKQKGNNSKNKGTGPAITEGKNRKSAAVLIGIVLLRFLCSRSLDEEYVQERVVVRQEEPLPGRTSPLAPQSVGSLAFSP